MSRPIKLKKYYVRFWCEGQRSVRAGLTDRLKYNDVFKCYEGTVPGRDPDDVIERLNDCYVNMTIKRCGEINNVQ